MESESNFDEKDELQEKESIKFKEYNKTYSSQKVLKMLSVKFKDSVLLKENQKKNKTQSLKRLYKEGSLIKKYTISKNCSESGDPSSKNSSGEDVSHFSNMSLNKEKSDIEIEKSENSVGNSNKSNKGMIFKLCSEMESLFVKAITDYFIDSDHNLPEYYEHYVIQNLKVINRIQFFLYQKEYDVRYSEIANKVSKINEIDYSKHYIILDLDETLIHSTKFQENDRDSYYSIIEIPYFDEEEKEIKLDKLGIYVRPYCFEFLAWLKTHFNLILFTAAEYRYASYNFRYPEYYSLL